MSVICLFQDMPKLVKCLLTCRKSIEKAWLVGLLNGLTKIAQIMLKVKNKFLENARVLNTSNHPSSIKRESVYRETFDDFCPAFVGDLLVVGHAEAGNRLVDLQETA